MDWSDPNLWIEGLGSALVSGLVAAMTALLVVRLSDRAGRRHQLEVEARVQAVRVMALGKEISSITSQLAPRFRWSGRALNRRRNEALLEFQIAAFTLEAMLVPVSPALALRLQMASRGAGEIDLQWVRTIVDIVAGIYGVQLVALNGDGPNVSSD